MVPPVPSGLLASGLSSPHLEGSWGPDRRRFSLTAGPAGCRLACLPPGIFLCLCLGVQFHAGLQTPESGFNQELSTEPWSNVWQSSARPGGAQHFLSQGLGWWPCGCSARGPVPGQCLQRPGEGRQMPESGQQPPHLCACSPIHRTDPTCTPLLPPGRAPTLTEPVPGQVQRQTPN